MSSIRVFRTAVSAMVAVGAAAAAGQAPAPEKTTLRVEITHLRNAKGMIHACLTQDQAHFPGCKGDAQAFRISVPADEASQLRFDHLPSGTYALSVIHDENGNGKLDTFAKIPREGYGFSGNPPTRFGPPGFAEASFSLTSIQNLQVVRVRYLL